MTDERFHLLAEKYLEGRLADDEARELAAALESSSDRRGRLLRDAALAGLLERSHRPPVDLVPRVQAALRDGADREALVGRVLQRLPARRSRWLFVGTLAAAALLVVALVLRYLLVPFDFPVPSEPVAFVEEASGNVRTALGAVQTGDGLVQGARLETADRHSTAQIRFPGDTTVEIRPRAAIVLEGERRLSVVKGTVVIRAGEAFLVATAEGEAWLRETHVSLHAQPGASRLEVRGGRVRFLRRSDQAQVEIPAGQYAVAAAPPGPEPFDTRPAVNQSPVNDAVRRGVAYLRKTKLPVPAWQGPMTSDELVLYALLRAGVPESDPFAKELLGRILESKLQRTYPVSLQAVVLAEIDPVKHRDRLARCAQFLVDNQSPTGQWGYGDPTPVEPEGTRVKKSRDGRVEMGNNSCSALAALGLRACVEAGIEIPRETLERAARGWGECQRPDRDPGAPADRRGWCYTREEAPHRPYGSMTAGGVAAAAIYDALLGRDWEANPVVRSGLNWLSYHFSVHENFGPVEELMAKEILSDTPSPMTEFYYYLWALERAATVCGHEILGSRRWWSEGALEILAAQRADGSWSSGPRRCNPVWDTCYAILFLTHATRPIEVKR